MFQKFRKVLVLFRRKIVNTYFNVAMSHQKLCCKTSIPMPLNTFQNAKHLKANWSNVRTHKMEWSKVSNFTLSFQESYWTTNSEELVKKGHEVLIVIRNSFPEVCKFDGRGIAKHGHHIPGKTNTSPAIIEKLVRNFVIF